MNFLLKDFSIVNGARFVPQDDGSTSLILTIHITSYCDAIPYDGAFQQIDYNVDLTLDPNTSPNDLITQLPTILQSWVNNKYPNI